MAIRVPTRNLINPLPEAVAAGVRDFLSVLRFRRGAEHLFNRFEGLCPRNPACLS